MVWIACMGLAVGLLMIISLLSLIVYKGLEAFWPTRVAQLTLVEGSNVGISDSNQFAGEIRKVQDKPVRVLLSDDDEQLEQREMQVFVGNKDVYGLSFKYIDLDQIDTIEYPADIIKIERMEYGPAIGYAVRLNFSDDGRSIDAADPQFHTRLQALVDEANQRRAVIQHIEQHEIGSINAAMDALRVRKRKIERLQPASIADDLAAIEQRMQELNEQFLIWRDEAHKLRQLQDVSSITYRLPTGQERTIALGDVVSYSFPNDIGLTGRAGLFLSNIWAFLSDNPREANTEGGIFPAIFGTFVMTVLLSLAVTPFGVLTAIYLREYAREGVFVRAVRVAINNLAGVPSIVFGVFGLGFFVYFLGGRIDQLFYPDRGAVPVFGTGGILWASLTLALMTVPVVIVATEESLAAVSRGSREGSLACGASKWQTIRCVVLPAATPGIITGMILAMARGAGEVAPLMLVGVVKLAPSLPIDSTPPFIHLDRKFMHLGFHIFDLGFQSPDSEAAQPMVFATTLLLISLVVVMNLGAIVIRERLRRTYSTGAF